ncbi:MAG: YaaA family protein [Desulfobacteraceae bacterium]|nr:YaaA family protein [Desulfobacteraceae bacterium]
MKIIISPAKTMAQPDAGTPGLDYETDCPAFQQEAERLIRSLEGMQVESLKALFKTSDAIARKTREQILRFKEARPLPALMAFKGTVFKALAPNEFDREELMFARENLIILSALYGVLRPFDGIVPHRLDMNTPLKHDGKNNLRAFWKTPVTQWFERLLGEDEPILNLASIEYERLLTKGPLKNRVFSLEFLERKDGKLKSIGAHSKQARGLFLKEIVRTRPTEPMAIQSFEIAGYRFREDLSSPNRWVFVL